MTKCDGDRAGRPTCIYIFYSNLFKKIGYFYLGASDPLGNIWGKLENYHSFCRFVACRKNKQVWKPPYIINKTLATTLNRSDSIHSSYDIPKNGMGIVL